MGTIGNCLLECCGWACLAAGIASPIGEEIAYLELGYGQGLAVNIHAAATAGTYWGNGFQSHHALHASALANASRADIHLLSESFAELAARNDLPQFDVIALHGIWSWISDKNREFILDIIRRNLRVGGIVYISYNCFPGWAPPMPVRHLMDLHIRLAGTDTSGAAGNIDAALRFVQRVADAGSLYFHAVPALTEFLTHLRDLDRNYMAHEYFNKEWGITNFSDVHESMKSARLTFVASAHALTIWTITTCCRRGKSFSPS